MGDLPLAADFIKKAVPLRAKSRLKEFGRIIDAGVDYLAVSAARLLTESGVFFYNQHVLKMCRKLFRDSQTDDAHSNYGNLKEILCLHKPTQKINPRRLLQRIKIKTDVETILITRDIL
jgi:hypothetical protein